MHSFHDFERFCFQVDAMVDKYPILYLVGAAIIILLYLNKRRNDKGGDSHG